MRTLSKTAAAARFVAAVTVGALAVHQLRYLVGYGGEANRALHEHGHGELPALPPALLALAGAAVAFTIVAGLWGESGRTPGRRSPLGRRIAAYGLFVLATFAAQELAEGLLLSGHPGGLAAVLGHAGLCAIPLALGAGILAWLGTGLLEALERRLGPALTRLAPRAPRRIGHPYLVVRHPPSALALARASRAPPLA